MAYFSNGTEGEMYEAKWCARCVHYGLECGCPVWGVHFFCNSEQFKNESVRMILDSLIPRTKDGVFNEQCAMFIEKEG
jgi:hypothetical protein